MRKMFRDSIYRAAFLSEEASTAGLCCSSVFISFMKLTNLHCSTINWQKTTTCQRSFQFDNKFLTLFKSACESRHREGISTSSSIGQVKRHLLPLFRRTLMSSKAVLKSRNKNHPKKIAISWMIVMKITFTFTNPLEPSRARIWE